MQEDSTANGTLHTIKRRCDITAFRTLSDISTVTPVVAAHNCGPLEHEVPGEDMSKIDAVLGECTLLWRVHLLPT